MVTSPLGQTCFCFCHFELLVPGERVTIGSHFQMLLQQLLPTSLSLLEDRGAAIWAKGYLWDSEGCLGITGVSRLHGLGQAKQS